MRKIKFSILFISLAMFIFSCGSSTNENEDKETTADVEVIDDVEAENTEDYTTSDVNQPKGEPYGCGFAIENVDAFLSYVTPDGMPYTFESEAGQYIFFREDGSVAGGGPDGEPMMWEGTWSFVPESPTGMINIQITMQASDPSFQLSGAYYVEYFPDDAALIFNCVDFYKTDY